MNDNEKLNGNKYPSLGNAQNITWFDITEAMKTNVLITGSNSTGKSLTAMAICDRLMRQNWQVLVIDNVGVWKQKSSVPVYFEVSPKTMKFVLPETSIIYDISLLLPSFQREFTENLLMEIWNNKVISKSQTWQMIAIEESHLYMRNIRGLVSQNLMRICSVGRNHKIRCLAISPTLTGIDKEFVRLSSQRYHFKITPEQHTMRRFRSYYGLDWCRIARQLDTGFCIYYLNEKLQVVEIPLFQSNIKSQAYQEPLLRKKPSLLEKIKCALNGRSVYDESEDMDSELEEDLILEGEW